MGQFRKQRRRMLGFESLESRRMMAGDVYAGIIGGDLTLSGDNFANAVDVRGTGIPGEAIVTPLVDQATGQQTTINGGTEPVLLTGITARLAVDMKGGKDEFYIKDFAVPGNGEIWGGAGADTIRIGKLVSYGALGTGDVSFGGLLRIDEQFDTSINDNDYIFLGRVTVAEKINIWTSYGNDTVEMYNVTALGANTAPFAAVFVNGHDGNDVFNLAYITCWGKMELQSDMFVTGNDVISVITSVVHGDAKFDAWHGINTVALNANQFLGKLDMYAESGNDTFTLTNSLCSKLIQVTSFAGNDSIRIENNTIYDRLAVDAATGYDSVIIQSNQIAYATIYAGSDSDSVTIRYNVFFGHADFFGRAGYDVLYFSGNLFYSTYAIYEFESIQP